MVVVRKKRYKIRREEYAFWEKIGLRVLRDPEFVVYLPFYTRGLSYLFPFFPKNTHLHVIVRSARRIVGRRVLPKYYLRHLYNVISSGYLTPTGIQNSRKYERNKNKALSTLKKQNIVKPEFFEALKELYSELPSDAYAVFPINKQVLDAIAKLNKRERIAFYTELYARLLLTSLRQNRRKYRFYAILLKIPAYTKPNLFSLPLPKTIASKYNLTPQSVHNVIKALEVVFVFLKAFYSKKVKFSFASRMIWMGVVSEKIDVSWETAFLEYLDKRSESYYIKFRIGEEIWEDVLTGRLSLTAQEIMSLALGGTRIAKERKRVIARFLGIHDYETILRDVKLKLKRRYKGGEGRKKKIVFSLNHLKFLPSPSSTIPGIQKQAFEEATLLTALHSSLSYSDAIARFRTTHKQGDPLTDLVMHTQGSSNLFLLPPPLEDENTTLLPSDTDSLVYIANRYALMSYIIQASITKHTPTFRIPRLYKQILSPLLKLKRTYLKPFVNSILYLLSSSFAFGGGGVGVLDLALLTYIYPKKTKKLRLLPTKNEALHGIKATTLQNIASFIKEEIDLDEYRRKVKSIVSEFLDSQNPLSDFLLFIITSMRQFVSGQLSFADLDLSSFHTPLTAISNRLYLNVSYYPYPLPFRPKKPQKTMSYRLLAYYYAYGHLYKRVGDLRYKMPCIGVYLKQYEPHSIFYMSNNPPTYAPFQT